jgi:hypothetical protein
MREVIRQYHISPQEKLELKTARLEEDEGMEGRIQSMLPVPLAGVNVKR